MFKFSDRIRTSDGKAGIVQEDQEAGSDDVKVLIEGEDYPHILKDNDVIKDSDPQP